MLWRRATTVLVGNEECRQMRRVLVALRVPVGRPLPDLAAFIVRCEDAGFDGVGSTIIPQVAGMLI